MFHPAAHLSPSRCGLIADSTAPLHRMTALTYLIPVHAAYLIKRPQRAAQQVCIVREGIRLHLSYLCSVGCAVAQRRKVLTYLHDVQSVHRLEQ